MQYSTQELVGAIPSGFKSPLPHHLSIQGFRRIFRDGFGRGFSVLLLVTCKFLKPIDRSTHALRCIFIRCRLVVDRLVWPSNFDTSVPARRLPRIDRRTHAAGRSVESRSGRPLLSLSSKPRAPTSADRPAHPRTRRHHGADGPGPARADALRESLTTASRWGPVAWSGF